MNNTTDSFEAIAADAVEVLMTIIDTLAGDDDPVAQLLMLVLAAKTTVLCERAIALGGN